MIVNKELKKKFYCPSCDKNIIPILKLYSWRCSICHKPFDYKDSCYEEVK